MAEVSAYATKDQGNQKKVLFGPRVGELEGRGGG